MSSSGQNDDSSRTLNILEEEVLKTYARELEELAAAAAAGEQNVDLKLAMLVEAAPDHIRQILVKRFRALAEEMKGQKEEKQKEQALSMEDELLLRFQKEQEERIIAYLLSQKTLEKLRQAFLSNPLFLKQVVSMGEELSKKGILLDAAQQGREQLGQISTNPVRNTDYQKDKGRER